MTRFYIEPQNLEKWLHQNNAEYTGDYFVGVLLDNFTVSLKNGYAAIYEHYVNPNQSNYLVEFSRDFESLDRFDEITEKWMDEHTPQEYLNERFYLNTL